MSHDIFTGDAVSEFTNEPELPPGAKAIFDSAVARQATLAEAASKAATLLALTAVAMILLDRSVLQSFDLGPIRVTQLAVIQKGLPAFGAFLTYGVWSYSVRYWHADFVIRTINRIHRPALVNRKFASVSSAATPSIFAPVPDWLITSTSLGKILRLVGILVRVLYVVTPFALQVVWQVQLFRRFGPGDTLVWLSLFVALSLLAYAALLALAALKVGALRPLTGPADGAAGTSSTGN